MFDKIYRQLILSYLAVFTAILLVFLIAVRIFFVRSLNQQLMSRLETLARAASTNIDIEAGEFDIDREEMIVDKNQAVQWFDVEGNLLATQGDYPLNLQIHPNYPFQQQTKPLPITGFTVPVYQTESNQLISYIRVSESTQELKNSIQELDRGLAGGIIFALILSRIGGIWLTRQAMKPIEESFQRLKQFTADASHELRSPLMAIKSNASVALKYSEGIREQDIEKFHLIASATHQMTQLTENLLLLARADRVVKLKFDRVDLTSMLLDLLQFYQPRAQEKQIEMTAQIDNSLYLKGDFDLLKQIFINLIENAIYYTPSGGLINLQASQVRSHLIIHVQDSGIGIAPEHLEKVFERFWRVDQSRSYKAEKSGLGLAIAQTIAQQHSGLIKVTSQLELGSCFMVYLPTHV